MKKESKKKFDRDAIKQRGFKRFLKSWSYSIDGLKYAYKNEQSMMIHFFATILVVSLGLAFEITLMEWCFAFISIGLVLAGELINTSIEAVVDLVTTEIHPLAKIAKDCGSAATFVLSLISAIIGSIVFVPYIAEFIERIF